MPQKDLLILMSVGGGFILLGIAAIFGGRREEKSYFDSLTSRHDLREFMSHWPQRPQPGALQIGGWIAIAIGVVMLIVGVILWVLA